MNINGSNGPLNNQALNSYRIIVTELQSRGIATPPMNALAKYIEQGITDVDEILRRENHPMAPSLNPSYASSTMDDPQDEAPTGGNGEVQTTAGRDINDPNDPIAGMARAILPYLPQPKTTLDIKAVRKIAADVYAKMGNKLITVTVTNALGNTVTLKGAHKQFEEVFYWAVQKHRNVYLWGKAGGGKTTLGKQVSAAAGMDYGYFMFSGMTTPAQLLGFIGADAKTYWPSLFRELYNKPAIFLADEMDNASANTFVTMNGAIENGECQFPDGKLSKHDDFVVLGTGNTSGAGGNYLHADRRAMDAATRDRFIFIPFEYDEALEEALTAAIAPHNYGDVIAWIRKVRKYVEDTEQQIVISPRAAMTLAMGSEDAPFDNAKLIEQTVFKGSISVDTKKNIIANCPIPNFQRHKAAPVQPVPTEEIGEEALGNKSLQNSLEEAMAVA